VVGNISLSDAKLLINQINQSNKERRKPMKDHRVIYLRDKRNQIVGCVAVKLHREKLYAEYRASVLNPMDRFERSLGRQLALGRLVEAPFVVSLPSADCDLHEAFKAVMSDISKDTGEPTRAKKAAKRWLEQASAIENLAGGY
jgi:hypothetical protein